MTLLTVNDDVKTQTSVISADALLTKCHELLDELEKFQAFLLQEKKEHTVQLRQFRNSVIAELKSLEKVCISLSIISSIFLIVFIACSSGPNRGTHYPHSTVFEPSLL